MTEPFGKLVADAGFYFCLSSIGPVLLLLLVGFGYRQRLVGRLLVWLAAMFAAISGAKTIYLAWAMTLAPYPAASLDQPGILLWTIQNSEMAPQAGGLASTLAPWMIALGFVRPARRHQTMRKGQIARDPSGPDQADWRSIADAQHEYADRDGIVLGEAYRRDLEAAKMRAFARVPTDALHLIAPLQGGRAPLLQYSLVGRGHALTVGRPGGGKSSGFFLPTLATFPYTVVVNDPAAELYRGSHAARVAMSRRPVVIDPRDPKSYSINVLGWIDPANPNLQNDVCDVIGWLRGEEHKPSGENSMFGIKGWSLIECLLLDLIETCPRGKATLTELVRRVYLPEDKLQELLTNIYKVGNQSATLAGSLHKTTEKTFSGIAANAQAGLKYLTNTTFSKTLSGTTENVFTFDDVVNGNLDVFICIPGWMMKEAGSLVQSFFASILARVERRGRALDVPMLFVLDEAPLLRGAHVVKNAIAEMRKYKVVIWLGVQSISQMDEYYGKDATESIMAMMELITYVGITCQKTRQRMQEDCGYFTAMTTNISEGEGGTRGIHGAFAGGHENFSRSTQGVKTPLLSVATRLTLDEERKPDETVILHADRPPLRCGVAKWYRRPEFIEIIGATGFTPTDTSDDEMNTGGRNG